MKRSFTQISSIITYILIFLLNGFLFYFLGNYVFLLILSAMVLLPIGSFFLCLLLSHCIKVQIQGSSFVENRNDEFMFHIVIDNPSPLFLNNCYIPVTISNTLYQNKQTHNLNLFINPMSPSRVSYPVKSEHCGVLTIEISNLYLYDMFHMFYVRKSVHVYKEIPVLPNYSVISEDFTMDFSQGYNELEESPKKGCDTSEISDIREYIPGDRLSDIHWKLSAKLDELMVKEHVSLSTSQLVFYIELSNQRGMLDSVLDYAYGVGHYLCLLNMPYTFLWYSSRKQTICSHLITSKEQLKNTMMEILFESPIENASQLQRKISSMSGYSNFITIGVDYVSEKSDETTE